MMGQNALSAGLQMMQNWQQWVIHQTLVLPFKQPGQDGEFGQKEHHVSQQWEMPSVAPGEE